MKAEKIRTGLVLTSLLRIFRLLPPDLRRQAMPVGALLFLNSLLDFLSLGALVPLIPLILAPETFVQHAGPAAVYRALGFSSPTLFAIWACLLVLLLFLAKNGANLFISKRLAAFSCRLFRYFSVSLHRFYFQKGFLFLREHSSTDLVRDVTATTARFTENLVLPLFVLLNEVLVLFLLVCGILAYEPQAFLFLALLLLPPFLVFFSLARGRIQRLQEDVSQLGAEMNRTILESFFGYADVKMTGSDERFLRKYADQARRYSERTGRILLFSLVPA